MIKEADDTEAVRCYVSRCVFYCLCETSINQKNDNSRKSTGRLRGGGGNMGERGGREECKKGEEVGRKRTK